MRAHSYIKCHILGATCTDIRLFLYFRQPIVQADTLIITNIEYM